MKITAFGASYSRTSINRQWAEYVSVQIPGDHSLRVLHLNDYDLPVYTVERHNEIRIPASLFGRVGDGWGSFHFGSVGRFGKGCVPNELERFSHVARFGKSRRDLPNRATGFN